MGLNVISNKQVHTRSVGCTRPRMTLGHRIREAGILDNLSEAARRTCELFDILDASFRWNDTVVKA